MNFGIPMSGKDPLEKKVNGVTYLLKPPIGSVERELKQIAQSVFDLRPHIDPALEIFDKKHKGKKLKEGQRMEEVLEIAQEMAEVAFLKNTSSEFTDEVKRKSFDLICCGWSGSTFKFEDIEEGNFPSDHIGSDVIEDVVGWYQDQMKLTGEDRKNSTRRPDANSESKAD